MSDTDFASLELLADKISRKLNQSINDNVGIDCVGDRPSSKSKKKTDSKEIAPREAGSSLESKTSNAKKRKVMVKEEHEQIRIKSEHKEKKQKKGDISRQIKGNKVSAPVYEEEKVLLFSMLFIGRSCDD